MCLSDMEVGQWGRYEGSAWDGTCEWLRSEGAPHLGWDVRERDEVCCANLATNLRAPIIWSWVRPYSDRLAVSLAFQADPST